MHAKESLTYPHCTEVVVNILSSQGIMYFCTLAQAKLFPCLPSGHCFRLRFILYYVNVGR